MCLGVCAQVHGLVFPMVAGAAAEVIGRARVAHSILAQHGAGFFVGREFVNSFELCAVAAPRSHAKSTALTHDYVLSVALFREQDFIVLVSATEDLAMSHLSDIAKELRDNEAVRTDVKSQVDTILGKFDWGM